MISIFLVVASLPLLASDSSRSPKPSDKDGIERAFEPQGPVLVAVRTQTLKTDFKECKKWITALGEESAGVPVGRQKGSKSWFQAVREWEPWSEEDLSDIQDCDSLPCKVKLNGIEVSQMASASEEKRMERYLFLIHQRVNHYEQTGERKEYEFPGPLTDPWETFERRGFRSDLKRPVAPALFVRKQDLAPEKMRKIHQVVDRRWASSEKRGSLWVRDAYIDHYFDGWGEWADIMCDPGSISVFTQAVFGELDLLKKTDLIALAMRGKMRSGFEELSRIYMDARFERIEKRAREVPSPTSPSKDSFEGRHPKKPEGS